MELKDKISQFIKSHPAFSLVSLNLLLLIIVFFQKDPFKIFNKTYDNASPFYEIKKEDISKIQFERFNLPESQKLILKESNLWKVQFKNKLFKADVDKVSTLINSLLNAKKFTVITSSKEKEMEYGFGNSEAIVVEIFNSSGNSSGKLTIGNATSGNFTYVKWMSSDDIYLVEDNLKTAIGRAGDEFFINNKINPAGLVSADLISVNIKHLDNPNTSVDLIKKDQSWYYNSKKVDSVGLTDLLNSITGLNPSGVFTEDNLGELSNTNKYQITYSFKKGENTTSIFLDILGKEKSGDNYYIKLNNESTIYIIKESQISSLLDFSTKDLKFEN
ncbi:MAG: DUF4340 domain-containing protein [Leptospiraceae bacterium]|nr:DUF4340 domain-containing protein [Leptospiraceae bacterium]